MKSGMLSGAAALAMIVHAQAYAQTDTASATQVAAIDEIIVLGKGQARQTQTIVADNLKSEPPGTSPIKLIERLPGVAVSGGDAFGAYEWAVRINIRGFAQQQLGFTLDGVPLGDMSYGNHNGLHISRAIISEDLGRAELAQGSGALDVAASNNLGGALKFFSRDPSEDFGVTVSGTYGDDNMWRGYAHLDTGEIGDFGTRIYGSYVNSTTDKWKGQGEQNTEMFALKLVQPIGAGQLTGYYNFSDRREQDYQDFSLEMINRLGYDWDNFGLNNYGLAVNVADIGHNRGDTGQPATNPAAGTVFPGPIQTVDDAYYDASGLRKDDLAYLKLELPITEFLEVSVQGYYHDNDGQGLWGTPYVPSPNAFTPGATTDNAPLSIRTTEYDIDRTGIVAAVSLDLGNHQVKGGVWTEENDYGIARRFYGLDRAAPNRFFHDFQENPFFTQWQYKFDTETLVFYIQDDWQITDRLKLSAGFKNLHVENVVHTQIINNGAPVAGTDADLEGEIVTDKNFLPQAGVNYQISDRTEIFAGFSKNAAAFVSSPFGTAPFSSRSQTVFDETARTVSPETSKTFEAGLRTSGDRYQLGLAAYYVKFDDRLLAVSQGPGIVGNAPVVSNVGSVRTYGFEAIASYEIIDNLSVTGSYAYNNSEYADDVLDRNGNLVTAVDGATVVNTPKHIANADLAYDDGALFASVGANYLGDRFATFTNQGGRIDGRILVDASIGYRVDGHGLLDGLEGQVNVTNLLDKEYVGTVGTNGFVNAGDNQTLIIGAPRQWFVTVRKSF